jgi:2-dehydropantoate 2-reductase
MSDRARHLFKQELRQKINQFKINVLCEKWPYKVSDSEHLMHGCGQLRPTHQPFGPVVDFTYLWSVSSNTIQNVYFLGMGALGTMYAAKLQTLDESLVKIVVDEERRRQYEQTAITINGEDHSFPYLTPSIKAPAADLIIVAVKEYQLAAALLLIEPFVGPDTFFLSLLNGISSEVAIGKAYGAERVLYAFGIGMDALRIGRSVNYADMGYIVFGESDNCISPRVEALKALFDAAGIPYQVPADIHHALWFKFMLNVAVNQVSALLRVPFGVFAANQEARDLLVLVAREVQAVAQQKGIALSDEDIGKMVSIVVGLNPSGRTSMLQDVDAGRRTELDTFAGSLIREGEALGVPTPINRFLYEAITLLEKGSLIP